MKGTLWGHCSLPFRAELGGDCHSHLALAQAAPQHDPQSKRTLLQGPNVPPAVASLSLGALLAGLICRGLYSEFCPYLPGSDVPKEPSEPASKEGPSLATCVLTLAAPDCHSVLSPFLSWMADELGDPLIVPQIHK